MLRAAATDELTSRRGRARARDSTAVRGRDRRRGSARRARRRRRHLGRRDQDLAGRATSASWPSSASPTSARTGIPRPRTRPRELAELGLSWHFIGQIQSNKAARIAGVRRRRALGRLGPARAPAQRRGARTTTAAVDCLVQVSLDPERRAPVAEVSAPTQAGEVAAAIDACGAAAAARRDGRRAAWWRRRRGVPSCSPRCSADCCVGLPRRRRSCRRA